MPFQTAFKAPFNIVSNARSIAKAAIEGKDTAERMPPQKIAISFSPDEAMAASKYLAEMAQTAQREGMTIKSWDPEQRVEVEQPGFTLWGSVYGSRGELSPPALESAPTSAPVAAGATWG